MEKQAQLSCDAPGHNATAHHIEIKDLPAEQRIDHLRGGRKHFVDTIEFIAYRSETALGQDV